MEKIFWIGGSPCGGKSSVAEILSKNNNIVHFKIDDRLERDLSRVTAKKQPFLHQWLTSSWDERWMQPIETLLANAIGCYREHFEMLLPEIRALPKEQKTIIEGNPIFPDQCKRMGISASHALWLIAEPDFLRQQYQQREWVPAVLANCKDPQQAFANWMERDVQFGSWIRQECLKHGYPFFETSQNKTLAQNAAAVAVFFGLYPESN